MIKWVLLIVSIVLLSACADKKSKLELFNQDLIFASEQVDSISSIAAEIKRIPRTLTPEGEVHWANQNFDWTEGFFPGTLWYLYKFTKDEKWKKRALILQNTYKQHRFFTNNHDLGFVFNCSYGNAYKYNKDDSSKQILIDAANSLSTRFNANVGCIQSWDVDAGWQAKRGWQFPVIIDNMMNLELLFKVSEITGNSKYKKIAIKHANTTLENHFRDDNSSFHVIDYNPDTGEVRSKQTAQGYANNSAWARGQAWGLYGYTVCYRFTNDPKYLQQAELIADFIFNEENFPQDHIPYWDYDAPNISNQPRDVSAAAIIASALIELSEYTSKDYLEKAKRILKELSSDKYRAMLGHENGFILKHSVGSIPHNNEIDVPLNYADYYYVEALMRLLGLD